MTCMWCSWLLYVLSIGSQCDLCLWLQMCISIYNCWYNYNETVACLISDVLQTATPKILSPVLLYYFYWECIVLSGCRPVTQPSDVRQCLPCGFNISKHVGLVSVVGLDVSVHLTINLFWCAFVYCYIKWCMCVYLHNFFTTIFVNYIR